MKVEYPEEQKELAKALKASLAVAPPRSMELIQQTETQPADKPSSRALAELESRKAELLTLAQSITVQDQPSYEFAASLRQQVRKVSDAIEALQRPNINRLHEAHKEALADLKRSLTTLVQAESAIKAKQDSYQNALRRAQEEERRHLESVMEEARQRALAEEMAKAAAAPTTGQMDSVIERMAQPPVTVPMIPVKAKAAGASGTLVKKFRMVDPSKISPTFVLHAVQAEIAEKGECAWLTTQINKEVRYRGKGAEETVGKGSIEYYEEISTGVRR